MDMSELLELRARLWSAKVNRQSIGAAAGYAAMLEAQAGPAPDFDGQRHSADHLLALVEKAIRVGNAPKAPLKTKPAARPTVERKEAHRTEPEVKPEPEVKREVEAEPEAKAEVKPEPKADTEKDANQP